MWMYGCSLQPKSDPQRTYVQRHVCSGDTCAECCVIGLCAAVHVLAHHPQVPILVERRIDWLGARYAGDLLQRVALVGSVQRIQLDRISSTSLVRRE